MKKRLLSALLLVCLLLTLLPAPAMAADEAGGETGTSDGWVTENGKTYYYENGEKATGWRKDIPGWAGQWFYFDPDTGVMRTGWLAVDGGGATLTPRPALCGPAG